MDEFINELNEYNLCSWYLLPWVGLSPGKFKTAGFVNSYMVDGEDMAIAVKIIDPGACEEMRDHSCYQGKFFRGGLYYLVFWILEGWRKDYDLFRKGRYSKMSEVAKRAIRQFSGLAYQEPDGKQFRTSAILLALDDEHDILREHWRAILGDDVELPEELLSAPDEKSIIHLEEELTYLLFLYFRCMYIAVDFDGTVVTHEFPFVGSSIGAEPVLKELVAAGHRIILHTMRSNRKEFKWKDLPEGIHPPGEDFLNQAVSWFEERGIALYGIQSNPVQHSWTDSPKPYAHLYIDDAALGCPLVVKPGLRPYADWKAIRKKLVSMGILPMKQQAQ